MLVKIIWRFIAPAVQAHSRWTLAACLAIAASCSVAHGRGSMSSSPFDGLDADGVVWTSHVSLSAGGVPFQIRMFSSALDPGQLAERYSEQHGRFQRVLVAGGTIALSGLRGREHWLAELRASSAGSVGRISVMQVGATVATETPHPLSNWLPGNARLRFSHKSPRAEVGQPGSPSRQDVVEVAMPERDVTAYLRRQLRAEGWMPEPIFAQGSGAMFWRRRSSQLIVSPRRLAADRTSLFVSLVP